MRGDAAKKALKTFVRQPIDDHDQAVAEAVERESDRATVVILGSLLEDDLRRLLTAKMRPLSAAETSAIYDFGRPLGSFSAMIDIAYAFHAIDRNDREDLHLIREMRNACAHAPRDISFETPELAAAAFTLRAPTEWMTQPGTGRAEARAAFQLACGYFGLRVRFGQEGGREKMQQLISEVMREMAAHSSPSPL